MNIAVAMLTVGFATVHEYSASLSPYGKELAAGEQHAKDARKGIWSIIDPQEAEREAAVQKIASGITSLRDIPIPTSLIEVLVSDIGTDSVFVQKVNSGLVTLKLIPRYSKARGSYDRILYFPQTIFRPVLCTKDWRINQCPIYSRQCLVSSDN